MTPEGEAPADPLPAAHRRRRLILGPSLQRRIGRFTFPIVALAVLVTGLGGYVATRVSVEDAVDAVLGSVSDTSLRALGPSPDMASVQRHLAGTTELDDDILVAVVWADGRVVRAPGPRPSRWTGGT